MKKSIYLLAIFMCSTLLGEGQKLYLTIGDRTMSATLVDNSSTKALVELLQPGDLIYEANDYGGFEKVGDLGLYLPPNDESITTQAGDLILYQGHNLCIYYGVNTYQFTRLGKIDEATAENIREFVKAGEGSVEVTLSLTNSATALKYEEVRHKDGHAYNLVGQPVDKRYNGVVIQNGKKRIQ